MTSDMLGEERSPWGQGFTPVLPIPSHLGLCTMVTFSIWPIVPALLVCLTAHYIKTMMCCRKCMKTSETLVYVEFPTKLYNLSLFFETSFLLM